MSLRHTLFATACLLGLTSAPQAAPALWEVRDDDSAIRIFGSIHVLPEHVEWRTPLFDQIMADADKVVFETDISPEAMAGLGAQALAQGIYVDGTLLTDVIDAETERKLRQSAADYGMEVGPLLAMRPWLAASTISTAALAGMGFDGQGVEFVLEPELAPERLAYLETGEQQLAVMTAAPDDEQVAMLQSTLDDLPIVPKLMSKMLRSWTSGTPEGLASLFAIDMGGMESAFMDRLIYERNRNWIAPLERMLSENEENLVIVGAGHLTGEGSVLDLLEQAGYEIERLQ